MNVPTLEESIEIAASPAEVWALVSDPRRLKEWSPQVDSTRLADGHDDITVGTRLTNRNVQGELAWITHAEVVRLQPGREIAFRIEENWSVWSFLVEPTAAGVRLTQRREAPEGLSPSSVQAQETWLGGQAAFTETLRAGMSETLHGIRAVVEQPA
jgi:uncharacterized protein YndB with AHSA1/START domain